MNLLERAQSLSSEIQTIAAMKKRSEQADLFEKRAKDLAAPADEIKKFDQSITVIASNGIATPALDRPLIGSLRGRITDLRDRYASDKNAALDPFPGEDARVVLNKPLTTLPPKVKTALHTAWRSWAQAQIPAINNEVLNTLGGITVFRDSVGMVRNLITQANAICERLPEGNDSVDRLHKLCKEIADEWHNLTGEGIPTDVLVFLRASGTPQGAAFDALTTEVLDWLTEHGLRNALRLRVG